VVETVITFLLTKNPDAALAFYRDKLGLTFRRDDGYALVFDMDGVTLRISKVDEFTPQQGTALGWESQDIRADIVRLKEKGVGFEIYPNMGQDELGIAAFPGGDKVAWFKDPDGNTLSLTQHSAAN
jgi:catechol 2,3-dioxygenase-like lactoylglutathione lyase family enzyme